MRLVRNIALLLTLTAGSLALPSAAQQETMPDIYDSTPRSSAPVTMKKAAKPSAVRTVARRAPTTRKSTHHVVLASARPHHGSAAGK